MERLHYTSASIERAHAEMLAEIAAEQEHLSNALMTDEELLRSVAIHSDYESNGPRAQHQA